MLPTGAGSNAISTLTKVDVNMTDSSEFLPACKAKQTTFISLSRYNDLLYIEQNLSSIINYKIQQILDMERLVEEQTNKWYHGSS